MQKKTVKELMTPDPCFISPDSSIEHAAQRMQDVHCGVLPVGTRNRLEGILTDRDIVLRAVSRDRDADDTCVSDIMTTHVYSCREDDAIQDAVDEMAAHHVGRLVVKDRNGQVSGILSFGGIVRNTSDPELVSDVMQHAGAGTGAVGMA